jgi:hypothetical protein
MNYSEYTPGRWAAGVLFSTGQGFFLRLHFWPVTPSTLRPLCIGCSMFPSLLPVFLFVFFLVFIYFRE